MKNIQIIVQRAFVDKLFEIHDSQEDLANKALALQAACRESRVLEQLLAEEAKPC